MGDDDLEPRDREFFPKEDQEDQMFRPPMNESFNYDDGFKPEFNGKPYIPDVN